MKLTDRAALLPLLLKNSGRAFFSMSWMESISNLQFKINDFSPLGGRFSIIARIGTNSKNMENNHASTTRAKSGPAPIKMSHICHHSSTYHLEESGMIIGKGDLGWCCSLSTS